MAQTDKDSKVQGFSAADYRDHHATIQSDGKRRWIYPKMPKGVFYKYRKIVSYFLMAFLFLAPYIRFKGQPILLLNILERKFVVFGLVFWPQDLHILVFGGISVIIFIVLFTAIFGRLFCGWACPQTIFMELLFRRIEYLIEGDYLKQMKLKQQAWNGEKILKKTSKHIIFYILSFFIANTFLAYIIGSDRLIEIITDPPAQHIQGLTIISIFSFVFYGVFAFLREQVCCFICPYGRMQSVLLDNNSVNVMYDFERGENRGTFAERKRADRAKKKAAKAETSTNESSTQED